MAKNAGMLARLKKAAANWKKATQRESSFGATLDDGIYVFQVTGAELGESQGSGRAQVAWEFTVTEGDSKGEKMREYDGLETEDNLFFLQQRIGKLGYEIPEDIGELEALLKKIVKAKPSFRGRVKTKDEYSHVYIVKAVESGSGESEAETETEVEAEAETEVEAEAEAPAIEVNSEVKFTFKGDEMEGTVKAIEGEGDEAVYTINSGKKNYKVKADKVSLKETEAEAETETEVEAEAETEVEAEAEAPAGSGEEFTVKLKDTISFKVKGKPVTGVVVEILEDSVKAKAKDGTVYKVKDETYDLVSKK